MPNHDGSAAGAGRKAKIAMRSIAGTCGVLLLGVLADRIFPDLGLLKSIVGRVLAWGGAAWRADLPDVPVLLVLAAAAGVAAGVATRRGRRLRREIHALRERLDKLPPDLFQADVIDEEERFLLSYIHSEAGPVEIDFIEARFLARYRRSSKAHVKHVLDGLLLKGHIRAAGDGLRGTPAYALTLTGQRALI